MTTIAETANALIAVQERMINQRARLTAEKISLKKLYDDTRDALAAQQNAVIAFIDREIEAINDAIEPPRGAGDGDVLTFKAAE